MIRITWLGTATIFIDVDGERLLFDPFFRLNKKLEITPLEKFCKVDAIFNTHAHLDHACDLPVILKNSSAKLYAPNQTIENLSELGVDIPNKAIVVHPKQIVKTKNSEIVVHKSCHVKFDLPLIIKTALRVLFTFQFKKAIKLLKLNKKFPMKNEIYAYEIKANDYKIFLMGSAGYMKDYAYPKDVDLLVLPFQGRNNMTKYSIKIVEQIMPKSIILDHFDNAYPPITKRIKTDKFIKLVKEKFPKIVIIEPEYNKIIAIKQKG